MELHDAFEVDAPREAVWALMTDVPSVARCLPGAAVTADLGDGRYAGTMTVKLGPMGFGFGGEATVGTHRGSWSGTIDGRGTDKRGGSRGGVTVRWAMADRAGGGTRVTLDADVTLSGPAAQFGRTGILVEVSRRLLAQFVACLEAKLSAGTPEAAAAIHAGDVGGASLLLGAIGSQLRRGRGPSD